MGLTWRQVVVARARATCARVLGTTDRVSVQVADLNGRLPFEPERFDAVTALSVIEHIFDPYFTLAEIARILEPGGQFILEVPNLAWLPRRLDGAVRSIAGYRR